MRRHTKIKLSRSELSKLRALETDRHTDRRDWKHCRAAFRGWK